jgi:hypothetical protein
MPKKNATTEETETTENVRRVRAILPRPLYRRLTIAAATEETCPNDILNKALVHYLDQVEMAPGSLGG